MTEKLSFLGVRDLTVSSPNTLLLSSRMRGYQPLEISKLDDYFAKVTATL
jgi:hypothetical protein